MAMESLRSLHESLELDSRPDMIDKTYAGWHVERVVRTLLISCSRARYLLDKTPAFVSGGDALARAETFQPFYVWLVRHPLGVARSKIERRWSVRRSRAGFVGRIKYGYHLLRRLVRPVERGVQLGVKYWADAHRRTENFLEIVESQRQLQLTFEELVRDPRRTMQSLCGTLRIALEEDMFEPRKHAPKRLRWGLGDDKLLRYSGMDGAVADRWREHLSEWMLNNKMLRLMERLEVGRKHAQASSAASFRS